MAKVKCPECHREGTYSPKFKQCSACGLGYEPTLGSEHERIDLVRDSVTPPAVSITNEQSNVTHNVTGDAGRHCSSCTCGPPRTNAERQKAWRERQKDG